MPFPPIMAQNQDPIMIRKIKFPVSGKVYKIIVLNGRVRFTQASPEMQISSSFILPKYSLNFRLVLMKIPLHSTLHEHYEMTNVLGLYT